MLLDEKNVLLDSGGDAQLPTNAAPNQTSMHVLAQSLHLAVGLALL